MCVPYVPNPHPNRNHSRNHSRSRTHSCSENIPSPRSPDMFLLALLRALSPHCLPFCPKKANLCRGPAPPNIFGAPPPDRRFPPARLVECRPARVNISPCRPVRWNGVFPLGVKSRWDMFSECKCKAPLSECVPTQHRRSCEFLVKEGFLQRAWSKGRLRQRVGKPSSMSCHGQGDAPWSYYVLMNT